MYPFLVRNVHRTSPIPSISIPPAIPPKRRTSEKPRMGPIKSSLLPEIAKLAPESNTIGKEGLSLLSCKGSILPVSEAL